MEKKLVLKGKKEKEVRERYVHFMRKKKMDPNMTKVREMDGCDPQETKVESRGYDDVDDDVFAPNGERVNISWHLFVCGIFLMTVNVAGCCGEQRTVPQCMYCIVCVSV